VKEGEHGQCTLYGYENRIMKPVEIVLRRRLGNEGVWWREVNLIKICNKYIYKCHSETLPYN
jgi:hypothetical protein